MQDFRGLDVWHRARAHALGIWQITQNWPRRGYASLIGQLTSAAESVEFNIVEGAASATRPDFARFLNFSIRSASEVESQLQHAHDYGLLSRPEWRALTRETREIRRMLFGLRRTLLRAEAEERAREPDPRRRPSEQRDQRSQREADSQSGHEEARDAPTED